MSRSLNHCPDVSTTELYLFDFCFRRSPTVHFSNWLQVDTDLYVFGHESVATYFFFGTSLLSLFLLHFSSLFSTSLLSRPAGTLNFIITTSTLPTYPQYNLLHYLTLPASIHSYGLYVTYLPLITTSTLPYLRLHFTHTASTLPYLPLRLSYFAAEMLRFDTASLLLRSMTPRDWRLITTTWLHIQLTVLRASLLSGIPA